jgi:hypothetical protein
VAAEGAAFDVVLGLHVASALVALGSIATTGAYASMAGATARGGKVDAGRVQAERRFFRPGPNWPARVLFLVPAFGIALLAMDGGFHRVRQAWLIASVACWLVATAVALLALWPAETRIQRLLPVPSARMPAGVDEDPGPPGQSTKPPPAAGPPLPELARAAHQASLAAGVIDVVMVAAFVLMVAKPGA